MKIEIFHNNKWVNVLVLDAKGFPSIKVMDDPAHSGQIALMQSNASIADLRIDGAEGRYAIDFDGSLFFESGKPAYCYLKVSLA